MRRQLWRWLAAPVFLLSCESTGPTLTDDTELVLQIIPGLDPDDLADDQATITAAHVDGRTLFLSLQFGGGCAPHSFALVTGGEIGESNPPFTIFRLAHDGNRDPCDALLTRNVEVDLSPIMPLAGSSALRFTLMEPGERVSSVGELVVTF
jgi:hypothetical protein